jgi:hypothetical protein
MEYALDAVGTPFRIVRVLHVRGAPRLDVSSLHDDAVLLPMFAITMPTICTANRITKRMGAISVIAV